MRLADDTRGRVPFALLGVVLLVASVTVATTQFTTPPAQHDPAVDRAMREATATTQTALRDAITAAACDAARDPITQRASTPYGTVLNESGTFEDALRVRIYLTARQRLAAISATVGPVTASAWLPETDTPADLRAAKRRVNVSRAGPNGTALRVRIEGIRLRAIRTGRTVGEKQVAPTLTVASPVLELHDRVERFENRLDAGLEAPGFGRRFTARMYALAWVRGVAQYGGAPIANVVGNQHVALAANDAALGVQRETLGTTDPRGEDELTVASARALATDLAPGAIPGPVVEATLDRTERGYRRLDDDVRAETVETSPDVAADRALTVLDESALDRITRRTYGVDVRVVSDVSSSPSTVDRVPRPGPNWTRVGTTTRTERSIEDAGREDTLTPSLPTGYEALVRYDRRVVVRVITTTRWRREGETRTTTTVRTRTHGVALTVGGRHSPESRVARRGVRGVYEVSGALGGPNLEAIPSAAVDRLVTDRGGPNELARRAITGSLDESAVRLVGERPVDLRGWLRTDLTALDRRVRNVSLTLSQVDVGMYAVSPPARLAVRIRARRDELLDAPTTYDGVAEKTRVGVRRAYLDALLASLDARAEKRAARRADLNDTLGDHGSSLGDVRTSLDVATETPTPPDAGPTGGLGGSLGVTVDTAPSFLSLDSVSSERYGEGSGHVTSLDARNLNWVTVPYGDSGSWFARLVAGPKRVSLRSAAGTLRASGRLSNVSAGDRDALRGAVKGGVAFVGERLADSLAEAGVCETTSDCRGVVAAGLGRWETPAARALALANGSASGRIAAVASVSASEQHRLAATLRTTTREALRADGARPPQSAVSSVSDGNRAALRGVVERVATDAGEAVTNRVFQRTMNRTLDDVPLGIPVAPVPGYWYATLNGWSVSVEGTYDRLTVRSRRGVRDTVYVRDDSSVALDVDGDGVRERLGTAPSVSFEASTTVVVVVPAGDRGIADVDGTRDERSPGYPH